MVFGWPVDLSPRPCIDRASLSLLPTSFTWFVVATCLDMSGSHTLCIQPIMAMCTPCAVCTFCVAISTQDIAICNPVPIRSYT